MSIMFEQSEINGLTLSNRFVRSATWEGLAADDGAVTPELIKAMTDLAGGGVGLIISGHSYVSPEGQAGPRQLGIYKDELIPGLKEMTAAVHAGGGKMVMQLAHAGIFAPQKLTGLAPLAVSRDEGGEVKPCREITAGKIEELAAGFAEAARRAREAGFDGVQLHSAHGYLLSQFLSPVFNRREDEYGGNIENRSRIVMEVYRAVRKAVGEDYPMLIKLNCQDFAENGLSLDDSLEVGRRLSGAGLDAIELSGGLLTGGKLSPSRFGINSADQEGYFREEARCFKKEINIPLILVGGMRSFEVAEQLVEEGAADYISMSRPLIREPGLIGRWRSGDFSKSQCLSDNKCFRTAAGGNGVCCDMLKNKE